MCICDCGTITEKRWGKIKSGNTKSCGCLRKRKGKEHHAYKHGHARTGKVTQEHRIWAQMKDRCENPNSTGFHRYGGRGITVCSRWQDFENFINDMGPRPVGKSLDRIDNDGPYSPENCRWASCEEQMRNTRTNTKITHNGKTMCLVEWCEYLGVSRHLIMKRMKNGMSFEDAIKPSHEAPLPRNRLLTYKGKTQNITAWVKETGINKSTLLKRLRLGWSVESALTHKPR